MVSLEVVLAGEAEAVQLLTCVRHVDVAESGVPGVDDMTSLMPDSVVASMSCAAIEATMDTQRVSKVVSIMTPVVFGQDCNTSL